jgi:hypothetical protein
MFGSPFGIFRLAFVLKLVMLALLTSVDSIDREMKKGESSWL